MTTYNFDVLLLDDDPERRLAVQTCLAFLDIHCHNFDFVTWLQQGDTFNLSNIGLVLMGYSRLPLSPAKLMAALTDKQHLIPKLLLCEWTELETDTARDLGVLGLWSPPFRYKSLMDTLHQASVWRERSVAQELWAKDLAGFVGQSPKIREVRSLVHRVACKDASVMISGESGTGKEVIARALHEHSDRKGQPFVPVNCGAIPAELLESELFGHERGAFTGAISSRAGRFEMANGGTLFLDEIGDMPLPMQVKLLRVLQERQFERVGGSKTIEVDVRIITATHKHLETMIHEGEFREDLYYRLNVFPIEVPPLRERIEDLPLLINELVQRLAAQGLDPIQFHPAALESLRCHTWPGNVRELANLIERLSILHPNRVIGVSELPPKFRHCPEPNPNHYLTPVKDECVMPSPALQAANTDSKGGGSLVTALQLPDEGIDLKSFLEQQERQLIEQALDGAGQVVARAAQQLQIRRTTLVEKMRKYGISRA
ncbi:sigma-54 dependent transcriptional regulator [Nitrincola alkalisediminis]|uniref:sigma-54 dependent transcriptional regulator n=1 Tax=Nitrincola alkalisediminis TaxID=1366656 RepID=UPI0018746C61|nr:sigma-54 dependent transcriptional regulator [Nitrincola alkalisediminis]